MTLRALLVSAVACVGLTVGAAEFTDLSFERAAALAPVIVVGAGAVAFLVLLWTKVAIAELREARHPRRIVALGLAGVAVIALLTVLGVELPRE